MYEEKLKKIGGLPGNFFIVPLAAVSTILYLVIIVLVLRINNSTNTLADLMEKSGTYRQEATELQAGSSVLSETSGTFMQMPVKGDGSTNVGPLFTYAKELRENTRSGKVIADKFRRFGVSKEIQDYVDVAAENAEKMVEVQLYAISLMRSVYPFPANTELDDLPEIPLEKADAESPKEARVAKAQQMLLESDYAKLRYSLSESIKGCHRTVQAEFDTALKDCRSRISRLRNMLWAVIAVLFAMLIFVFAAFNRWLFVPLRAYAALITSDRKLKERGAIRELRLVIRAYNGLLKRRTQLEEFLRFAAETDALTGMPNRHSMERFVFEEGESGGSMAVILFDVNFLKRTNDTEGHLAGDQLLRTAGECIRECFGTGVEGGCYRIGGDEFAVILRRCNEEAVKTRIDRFFLTLEREGISLSVGYAFSQTSDENTFNELMVQADRQMYEQKKKIHRQDADSDGEKE